MKQNVISTSSLHQCQTS